MAAAGARVALICVLLLAVTFAGPSPQKKDVGKPPLVKSAVKPSSAALSATKAPQPSQTPGHKAAATPASKPAKPPPSKLQDKAPQSAPLTHKNGSKVETKPSQNSTKLENKSVTQKLELKPSQNAQKVEPNKTAQKVDLKSSPNAQKGDLKPSPYAQKVDSKSAPVVSKVQVKAAQSGPLVNKLSGKVNEKPAGKDKPAPTVPKIMDKPSLNPKPTDKPSLSKLTDKPIRELKPTLMLARPEEKKADVKLPLMTPGLKLVTPNKLAAPVLQLQDKKDEKKTLPALKLEDRRPSTEKPATRAPEVKVQGTTQGQTTPRVEGVQEKAAQQGKLSKLDCDSVDYKAVSECCGKPAGSFFSTAQLNECAYAGSGEARFRAVTNFVLPALLASLNGSDVPDSACFLECLFREEGLASTGGPLDWGALRTLLRTTSIKFWKERTTQALEDCKPFVADFRSTFPAVTARSSKCAVEPLAIMQCIRAKLLSHCPEEFLNKSGACSSMMGTASRCASSTLNSAKKPSADPLAPAEQTATSPDPKKDIGEPAGLVATNKGSEIKVTGEPKGPGPKGEGKRGPESGDLKGPKGEGKRGPESGDLKGPKGEGKRGPEPGDPKGPKGDGKKGGGPEPNKGPGPKGEGKRGPELGEPKGPKVEGKSDGKKVGGPESNKGPGPKGEGVKKRGGGEPGEPDDKDDDDPTDGQPKEPAETLELQPDDDA